MSRYFHDIVIAIESIMANQLRSLLTALGIIFGVAAVITMLAIGKGAQQEILEQIKMVGVNNIIVSPIKTVGSGENGEEEEQNGKTKKKYSPGLTLQDLDAIRNTLPTVKRVSPEITLNSFVIHGGNRASAKLMGVNNEYYDIFNLQLEEGVFFNDFQEENGIPVCVIGANIRNKFFADANPIGNYIKFDRVWLKIVGVLEMTNVSLTRFEDIGVNVMNDNIYVPVKTMLMRFENRALVASSLKNKSGRSGRHFFSFRSGGGEESRGNYHQLDRIIVQVNESSDLTPSSDVLSRLLLRRHQEVEDFEITVPELLLKQEQRTKDIFNIVLGAIASISLLVGGIGIMNIMFASVMERIKEIGTRLAIGAKKKDIVVQFLAEAVLISVSGGLIGVLLGVIASALITRFADILTVVSPVSVIIAFVVSASVGVIFGYSPAKRASERDPIESLRYE
ncbi:MAG TPA: ABC transporter permease [Bacteroidales bacterium]|nr:ABC transporter permease [Bacteroidales bacterium]